MPLIIGANFIDGIEGTSDYFLVTDLGSGKLYKIAKDGTQTTVSGINFGMDGIAFDDQKLLGVNATNYFVITSSDKFTTAHVTTFALPNATSSGTSIVPYGKNMAAVSNVYGFSPNVTSYTIDIVPTKLDVASGASSGMLLWGALSFASVFAAMM